jgi:predicted nucleotidyltransferase
MSTLAHASLTDLERKALEAVVHELGDRLGPSLRSIWLYGSRARGEPPHDESDVDLLVVLDERSRDADRRVYDAVWHGAERAGASPVMFSVFVYDVERIAQRREIESFFIQEVDRDKIVLFGEP